MIIEEYMLENTKVIIHDDYILPKEKSEEIKDRLSEIAYEHFIREQKTA